MRSNKSDSGCDGDAVSTGCGEIGWGVGRRRSKHAE